jgi:hypothetical protein
MSWYADLDTHTMVATGDHVRAIGWLSSAHPFPQAVIPTTVVDRLREFVRLAGDSADALHFPAFGGVHTCELCEGFHHGCNFGVPAGGVLYVAPAMIGHYVERHRYAPPAEFVAALLACPLPGSNAFAVLAEPFHRLHEQAWERRYQERVEYAGRWAFEQGGTDEAVRQASARFFGHSLPEMCERIRRTIPSAGPGDEPAHM